MGLRVADGRESKRGHGRTVARGFASGVPLAGFGALRYLQILSSNGLGRAAGILLMASGVLLAGRFVVHLRSRYWTWPLLGKWTLRRRMELRWIIVGEVMLIVACLGAGAYFVVAPDNAIQLPAFVVLSVAIFLLGIATIHVIDDGGPPRGSEVVGFCRVVRLLRRIAGYARSIPFVGYVDKKLWDDRTEKTALSGLVAVIVVSVALAAAAQAFAVAPSIVKWLNAPSEVRARSRGIKIKSTLGSASKRRAEHRVSTADQLPPTAEELCGAQVPGRGAPELEAKALRPVWEELGQPATGCSTVARRVPGTASTYVVPGYCGRQFWSLGIVSPAGATVLLEPAARVAKQLLARGVFRFSSERRDVGNGDFYILDTTAGKYVLIRDQKTDGGGGITKPPLSCLEVKRGKEGYVVLPPAMAELWLRLEGLRGPVWPAVDASRVKSGEQFFSFVAEHGQRTVASGRCLAPTSCELRAGSLHWERSTGDSEAVTVTRIRELTMP